MFLAEQVHALKLLQQNNFLWNKEVRAQFKSLETTGH